jgi:2-amino-4-hydroxy-6-hydroxymethyldihydropteridine diphosphokinase
LVYHLGLGGNLGDRAGNIALAVRLLGENGVEVVRSSSLYETEPVDYEDQPWFLNQVLEVQTALDPASLLAVAKAVETEMGRLPGPSKGPRTMDVDILLAGDLILESPDLAVPHPRLADRNFVLVPLAEIAPDARHPVLGRTVRELAAACADRSRVTVFKGGG